MFSGTSLLYQAFTIFNTTLKNCMAIGPSPVHKKPTLTSKLHQILSHHAVPCNLLLSPHIKFYVKANLVCVFKNIYCIYIVNRMGSHDTFQCFHSNNTACGGISTISEATHHHNLSIKDSSPTMSP